MDERETVAGSSRAYIYIYAPRTVLSIVCFLDDPVTIVNMISNERRFRPFILFSPSERNLRLRFSPPFLFNHPENVKRERSNIFIGFFI